MTDLKQAILIKKEAKKAGGFRTIPDRRFVFPTMGDVPQRVILKTFEEEDIQVYNINFTKGKGTQITGEIADKLIFDFPEHFEVLAINGNKVTVPNEFIDVKGHKQLKMQMKGGKLQPYKLPGFKPLPEPVTTTSARNAAKNAKLKAEADAKAKLEAETESQANK